jgi:dynein heavy chain
MNQPWEDLDALYCEKFVNDGYRLLTSSLKHFRERNITMIVKIAERMRDLLDEFKPKVPLMVSLKKPGIKERHWETLSATYAVVGIVASVFKSRPMRTLISRRPSTWD